MATYVVKSKGKEYTVAVVDNATGGATVTVEEEDFQVEFVSGDGSAVSAAPGAMPVAAGPTPAPVQTSSAAPLASAPAAPAPAAAGGSGAVPAPIPGKVLQVHVAVGDSVSTGDLILTLEAMKMENAIAAPIDGTVKQIDVSEGSEVNAGQLLMTIE